MRLLSTRHVVPLTLYLCEDKDGVVHDGFGRTTGEGLRMIMVHAFTKFGPLVARVPVPSDEIDESARGFLIEEGYFK